MYRCWGFVRTDITLVSAFCTDTDTRHGDTNEIAGEEKVWMHLEQLLNCPLNDMVKILSA